MAERTLDPMTGVGGGTGLMELSLSSDAPATSVLPPDHAANPQNGATGVVTTKSLARGGMQMIVPSGNRHAITLTPRAEVAAAMPMRPRRGFWGTIHSALSGRYKLAIAAGVLLAGGLGYVAWAKTRPAYTSAWKLHFEYTTRTISKESDDNKLMQGFEMYLQGEKEAIKGPDIVDRVKIDPIWASMGVTVPGNLELYFQDHVIVERRAETNFIKIAVTDPDEKTSQACVTAIFNAYSAYFKEQHQKSDDAQIDALHDKISELSTEIDQLNAQVSKVSQPYGTSELGSRLASLVLDQNKLNSALTDYRLQMVGAAARPVMVGGAKVEAVITPDSTPEQVAALDPLMLSYVTEQGRAQKEYERLSVNYGPNHPAIQPAKRAMENAKHKVNEYMTALKQAAAPVAPQQKPEDVQQVVAQRNDNLKAGEAILRSLLEETKQEIIAVGQAKREVESISAKLDMKRKDLNERESMIDFLRGKRVLSSHKMQGDNRPTTEVVASTKRPQIMGAALLGGLLLPAAVLVIMSLINRKFRSSTDTFYETGLCDVPMLGILPQITGGSREERELAAAGYAIHHLRVLLANRMTKWRRRTLVVTSPVDGCGKTSIAAGLALSFAAARHKTLLIDCDFMHRSVTRGFKAQNYEGLFEAIKAGSLEGRLTKASDHLQILPTGRADAIDACVITPEALDPILAAAAQEFEIIIIDTGPILGSLESAATVQEADAVLLAVSRGESPTLATQAVRRLEALGTPLIGTVFNRAALEDVECYSSPSASSVYNAPRERHTSVLEKEMEGLGSVARAVAATIPSA